MLDWCYIFFHPGKNWEKWESVGLEISYNDGSLVNIDCWCEKSLDVTQAGKNVVVVYTLCKKHTLHTVYTGTKIVLDMVW